MSASTGERIETGLSRLQTVTAETQQYLFWQSAALILLTALLVTVFTFVLMRPIRAIDSAISQLGKGTFSKAIVVRGPTDLVNLGRQLEWLRMRLLELAQERNRFLRHMSHELKTPLASIREGTELLMDGAVGELDSAQREVTTILRDNGIKLQQLIENLLSFSAWQARHSGLEISEFRLRPLIKSTLETHQLTLLAQRVHLDLKVQDVELRADRAKLKLILDNLLSNALKYSPRGGTIFIHAHADKDLLVLDVADTGPGISQGRAQRHFRSVLLGPRPHGRPPERHRDRPVGRLGIRAGPRRLGGDPGRRVSRSAFPHPPAAGAAARSGAGLSSHVRASTILLRRRAWRRTLPLAVGVRASPHGCGSTRNRRAAAGADRAAGADLRAAACAPISTRWTGWQAPTRRGRRTCSTKSSASTRARRRRRARCATQSRW